MAIALRSPVNTLSDKDKLNSSQSKSFEKFWRNRCSHDLPYLPNCRKLILPGMTRYKINVSIRNDLNLLFNFVVSSLKTSLQISLYWLSTLNFFTSIQDLINYKYSEYQLFKNLFISNYVTQPIEF